MNSSFLAIYRAVSEGRLTQAQALMQIKALKQQASRAASGLLLATRQWSASGLPQESDAAGSVPAPQKVLLWGFSGDAASFLERHLSNCKVLEVTPYSATTMDAVFADAALMCFDVIKSLLANKVHHAQGIRLQLVVADAPELPVAAGLDALLKTAMEENPALLGGLTLVPADIEPVQLLQIVQRESACAERATIRYQHSSGVLQRQMLGWQVLATTTPHEAPSSEPTIFKEGGCYLITGGAGGIGLQFAREIVRQTTRARIVLAGRSAPSADTEKALRAAAGQKGHRIEYVALDVTQAEAFDALVARLHSGGQTLNGIIHCAGIIRDNFVIKKAANEFASVLSPKVAGVVNLDRATQDLALDFVLLCSSVAACWGNSGQADYAAANGFMDDFARYRNRLVREGKRHGHTLSVNWPLWRDGGMTLDAATRVRLEERTGMQALQTASAMRATRRGFALACDQLLVMEGELPTMQALLDGAGVQADADVRPAVQPSGASVDDAFEAKALEYLCQQFSQVLKVPVAKLRPQTPLEHYGMNSILALQLVTHLESIFGKLPKTLAFEYQTIAQMSAYFCKAHAARLADKLGPQMPAPTQAAVTAVAAVAAGAAPASAPRLPEKRLSPKRADDSHDAGRRATSGAAPAADKHGAAEPIAIIGLSGRYPEAWDLDEYWQNLAQGKDCIREVPPQRWRWQDYYRDPVAGDALSTGQHTSKWGGFIAGADEFDPRFFNISPRDAQQIDPQERLFLQQAWMAIEDAGYTRAGLQAPRGAQVGVYAGVMYGEYNRSGSLASIANRVSAVLNLHGPSMTLDTMCSSSLAAIHIACQDLRLGRTDLAIAGGVNLSIHPGKYSMLSAGQFISSDGHCQSFGEGGDGYIPGEGVGVVLLKRLADAERDGDAIHAIVRASALNHGGKTNGYTVPNPQAQSAVVQQALQEAQIHPRVVSYIEAHGTGTKLGDPIEIAALTNAFQPHTQDTQFCLIGSAKSNIGHCESAAGIAGLTKVILQMRHRQIVPSLHSQRLNPHIDFASSPFIVNQQIREWLCPQHEGKTWPRVAGISSFGAGGANAHLLVEEYSAAVDDGSSRGVAPYIVVLSARTFAQLQQKAVELKAFVERETDIDLWALSCTLQLGREAMDERLGMLVHSRADLLEKLTSFVVQREVEDGGVLADDLVYAQVRKHRDSIALFDGDKDLQASVDNWFRAGKLSRLIDIWAKGLDVDWQRLYVSGLPKRLHLPTYPFARERYWREESQDGGGSRATASALHSVLHHNTSKPGQQRYRSVFLADDARCAGVKLFGQRSLPRGILIEAARVALADALPALAQSGAWELQNMRFAAPLTSSEQIAFDVSVMLPGQGARLSLQKIAFEILADGADPEVLCQGFAAPCADALAPALDIAQLRQRASPLFADKDAIALAARSAGMDIAPLYQTVSALHRAADGLLVSFELSESTRAAFADCLLPPPVIEGAMLAAQWLHPSCSAPRMPAGIAGLRVHGPCLQPTYAWIRSAGSPPSDNGLCVDIAICDGDGTVCVELNALELVEINAASAAESPSAQRIADRTFIGRASTPTANVQPIAEGFDSREALGKPAGITLTVPGQAFATGRTEAPRKPAIALATDTGTAPQSDRAASVVMQDQGAGIFVLRLLARDGQLDAPLISALQQALMYVRELPSLKALVIESDDQTFLRGDKAVFASDAAQMLWRSLASFPYPTLAMLSGQAVGAGFWLACLCDFIVAVDDQNYGFSTLDGSVLTQAPQMAWLSARFGEPLAPLLATSHGVFTGRQLQEAGWGAPVVTRAQLLGAVLELCQSLSDKSQSTLQLLKQHLAQEFDARLAEINDAERPAPDVERSDPPQPSVSRQGVDYHRTDNGHVHLQLKAAVDGETVLHQLRAALNACGDAEAVLLHSEFEEFLPEEASRQGELLQQVLFDLSRISAPVIAVLEKNASNAGFLLALACDLAVYNEEGRYGALALHDHRGHLALLDELVTQRLGIWGNEWMLTGLACSGREMQQRLPLLHVCAAGAVKARAQQCADRLRAFPRDLFRRKSSLAARVRQRGQSLGAPATVAHAITTPSMAETSLALASTVVRGSVDADGIVLVRLEDRDAKNLFSDALIAGLQEVFEHVRHSASYKAVVLVGYDTYFASGGTREGLKAIQQGKVRFTDSDVFQLALRCPLPVIAAMQGHGIGAGWTLGLFSDCLVFSEESHFLSPYMSLGFTPGAGATGVLPLKLGLDLARESLFTGRETHGGEIKRRNPLLTVVPRDRVLQEAMAIARALCRHEREDLVAWKFATAAHRLAAWQALFAREVAMHEATLVGQANALERIERRFAVVEEPVRKSEVTVLDSSGPTRRRPRHQLSAVRQAIKALLAKELHLEPGEIDDDRQFVELGLDSISGVSWIRAINQAYGTTIEATKVYTYPTLEKFADAVRDMLGQAEAGSVEEDAGTSDTATGYAPPAMVGPPSDAPYFDWQKLVSWRANETGAVSVITPREAALETPAIAVIGMAGRFPMASDAERFWENIASSKNCVSEVPVSRWNMDSYFVDGKAALGQSNSKWMGVLEGHDRFDPLFFGFSPVEAEAMDPQQRLFLQCCWHGMESAGYTAERLSGSKCGVFVGCAAGDYSLLSRAQQINALGFTGSATSILAARVSYFLNLQGPCISIDTACSSSLVGIAMACDSLVTGASDLAFAGGVYVMANADMFLKTSHAGMLSPDGRCYTFDQRANGFVPGEGVGVVLLKRLADAQRDGDHVLAVVRGWGVNQDGKTNGITAPNAESQQRLIKDVYDKFSIDPNHIQLVEAHGTGTKLGDPIEIEGLKSAFRPFTGNKNYCAIGSVKTNIGHCLTAAGISGFIKLLMAIKHRQLPPSINFETPNEHLDLDDSPFYVNTALRDWTPPAGVGRHAAISSFGFSGTNAHLVLAEYAGTTTQADAPSIRPDAGAVIPLSARTPEQLLRKASDLRDFVKAHPEVSLARLSYSLQAHRDAMDERLCFVAHRAEEVIDCLNAFVASVGSMRPMPGNVFAGNIKQGWESVRLLSEDDGIRALVIDKCMADDNMERLCELWAKGLTLDWRQLYGTRTPAAVALPPYPFSEDSYWVVPSETVVGGDQKPKHFHPLLHEKVLDIREQGYRQTVNADGVVVETGRKIPRMPLPTYAFSRTRCWIPAQESAVPRVGEPVEPLSRRRLVKNLDSVAELFDELEQDTLTASEVIQRVKSLA